MKSVLAWLTALCLLLNTAPLAAAQKAGLLKTASGEVSIQRGETRFTPRTGTDLLAADMLITGEKSYAGIIFTDGTLFTLGPQTRFTLEAYRFEPKNKIYDFAVYLEKGSGLYESGKIGKLAPESVRVSTPKATVGIRGTRFIIQVEE